ncbi:MAG: hypothetical protein MUP11_12315 [Anaerolineales bacterium]|nr:hypothetical protein [Anaerolineales bacterium]
MGKVLKEITDDANFIKGHTLQPQWYKVLKIFLVLGLFGGHFFLFGTIITLVFLGSFIFLSVLVHMLYRVKTAKFTRTWLDFIVKEEDGHLVYERIGLIYYSLVLSNIALSLGIAHFLF